MCHNIDIKWLPSLDGISKERWTYVFGNSTIKGYDFFEAMEKSNFEGVTNHILTIRIDGNIVAIFPCFAYVLDALDLMDNNWQKSLWSKTRKAIPSFMKIRAFVIGTYVATVEDFCGIAEQLSLSFVDLGQTSYYPKIMSGAIVENVYYGFFSNIWLLNCFIKHGFKYLFPNINILENVYMDAYKKDIISHFRKYEFNNLSNI